MELEEAIERLKRGIEDTMFSTLYSQEQEEEDIKTVLNHLTKQEKMIELMSFGLLVPSIGHASCSYREKGTYCELEAENKRAKRCHKCIIKYYAKKAEESE